MKIKLLVLLILGIWTGMVLGISFLEAPLKFQAPNITLALGLGIGKIVFGALNKVEMIFSVLLIGWIFFEYKNISAATLIPLIALLAVVAIQSFWLLPIMDGRIDDILNGVKVAHTNHHFYYVGLEVLKVGVLIFSFIKVYKHE